MRIIIAKVKTKHAFARLKDTSMEVQLQDILSNY